ncbi:MAG: transaldolase [Spirochaetales bacterium]|nr:transaldolase [Spirochaetales bacterium]
MSKLKEMIEQGQSVWLDYIRRGYIDSGELKAMVREGIRGVTSNPTIFEKAIAGSSDYDEQLKTAVDTGASIDQMYEGLVVEDIRKAADVLRRVFRRTRGLDGYVSLEVSPELAYKTKDTIHEAERLYATVGKPNLMIKVPATDEGIAAIATLISSGINVNATLIFSVRHYEAVARAYVLGLEELILNGGDPRNVASVASVFVSRIDTAVDKELEERGNTKLKGKIAIANAKACVKIFNRIFSGERWEVLVAQGAKVQRLLWASTGTKNPAYPDTLYVDSLIGPHTVNTIPPATLDAFLDHGAVSSKLTTGMEEAEKQLEELARLRIDLELITEQLQLDGVDAFVDSFRSLRETIEEKARVLGAET